MYDKLSCVGIPFVSEVSDGLQCAEHALDAVRLVEFACAPLGVRPFAADGETDIENETHRAQYFGVCAVLECMDTAYPERRAFDGVEFVDA